jgi:hypothetical protein
LVYFHTDLLEFMFYYARANFQGRARVWPLRTAQAENKSEIVIRKVILTMHMSLDGLIAGPNGELDWTAADALSGVKETSAN